MILLVNHQNERYKSPNAQLLADKGKHEFSKKYYACL